MDHLEDAAAPCENAPSHAQKGDKRDDEDEDFEASLNDAENPGIVDDGADGGI